MNQNIKISETVLKADSIAFSKTDPLNPKSDLLKAKANLQQALGHVSSSESLL